MNNEANVQLSDKEIIRGVKSRQRKIKLMNLLMGIGYFLIILGIPAGFLMMAVQSDGKWLSLIVVGIVAIPVTIIMSKFNKKQERKLKAYIGEHVIKDVIAERIDIMEYAPDAWINANFIKKCMILPDYDRISGSDYIKGTYRGVEIVYCDLKLERKYKDTDSDGNTSTEYITVFHGHLINLKLGQDINGYVRIKERKTPRKEKGFLSDVLSGAADVLDLKIKDNVVEVENVAFNNQFEIKTNNEEMAFYILTPQFMENIIKADQLAHGYTNIEFTGKKANITLNNGRDSFEVTKTMSSAKSLEKSRQQVRNDLNIVLAIVDEILEKDKLF